MYSIEAGNLTAHSVMGGDRYMQLVSQRSVGFHRRADSTDVANAGEGEEQAEEEAAEEDAVVPPDPQTRSYIVERLRVLLNECLANEEFSDAAAVQQTVLASLSRGVPGQELETMEFHSLVMDVVASLDARFRRANNHSRSRMAPIFESYVREFETSIGIR